MKTAKETTGAVPDSSPQRATWTTSGRWGRLRPGSSRHDSIHPTTRGIPGAVPTRRAWQRRAPRAWAITAAALLVLGLFACGENPSIETIGSMRYGLVFDGAHNDGNEHFFFLPPMVPEPTPNGEFDGSLEIRVRICAWNFEFNRCGPPVAMFNTWSGPGSEIIRVDQDAEQYVVNWKTDDVRMVSSRYRIYVGDSDAVYGFADVQMSPDGKGLANVNTGEYIPLVDGRTLPIKFRIEVGAKARMEDVQAGENHTCSVADDGRAYCAGLNVRGQLGVGYESTLSYAPVLVVGDHSFQSVAAGGDHTCGITTDNDAYCWGDNWFGQLGTGTYNDTSEAPALVTGGHKFRSLSLGFDHTCGITLSGDAYCWGYNGYGQLGNGSISYIVPNPSRTLLPAAAASLTLGGIHTCGIATDNIAYCWGSASRGRIGNGKSSGVYSSPQAVAGGLTYQTLKAGAHHACGVTTGSKAYCWGSNTSGQLGDGLESAYKTTPQPVTGGYSFTKVAAGGAHTCGLTTGRALLCWGNNEWGQLGVGSTSPEPSYQPLPVAGGHVFESATCGWSHSCAIEDNGDIYCWGFNGRGQLGVGSSATYYSIPMLAMQAEL